MSNHRRALIKLCERENLKYDLYEEVASSTDYSREQLNLMLDRLDLYDYVVCMDIDRLSRSEADLLDLKQKFIINDIKILTPNGEINFQNDSSNLVFSFSAMLSEYEHSQIKKRFMRGKISAVEKGKFSFGGKIPIGYTKNEDGRLEIHPEESKIIQLLYDLVHAGHSHAYVCKQLDLLGYRSRSGRTFVSSRACCIITSEI